MFGLSDFRQSWRKFNKSNVLTGKFLLNDRGNPSPIPASKSGTDPRKADSLSGMLLLDPSEAGTDCIVVYLRAAAPLVELRVGVYNYEQSTDPVDLGKGAGAELGAVTSACRQIRFEGGGESCFDALGDSGTHRAEAIAAMDDEIELAVLC